jgi:DNA-directed RNA polymerase subunit D
MEITNITKTKSRYGFVLSGTTPAVANALRRSIVSLVPSIAIEDVEIYENNSALYDEIIALRLGLLPLVTDLETYELPKPGQELSAAHQVKLTLEAKGPCVVYASDLKCKDSKIKCAYPQMPIVKLLKNQSIRLEATARMGQAIEHAKWQSAHAFYFHQPIVIDGSKKTAVLPSDVIDQPVMEVFAKEDGTLNIPVVKTKQAVVEHATDSFIFIIEPYGQLKVEDIMQEAVKQLTGQLDAVLEASKAL